MFVQAGHSFQGIMTQHQRHRPSPPVLVKELQGRSATDMDQLDVLIAGLHCHFAIINDQPLSQFRPVWYGGMWPLCCRACGLHRLLSWAAPATAEKPSQLLWGIQPSSISFWGQANLKGKQDMAPRARPDDNYGRPGPGGASLGHPRHDESGELSCQGCPTPARHRRRWNERAVPSGNSNRDHLTF